MALSELMSGSIDPVDDGMLVQHCLHARDYVKDTIRAKIDRWEENWQVYNNQWNWDDKAEWQSKNYLPKFSQAVRMVKAIMKQSLIKSDDFFEFDGTTDKAKEIERDITLAVKRVLDQSEFKQKHFSKGLFRGLLENLIIYKTWVEPLGEDERIHENQVYKFPIKAISAFDLFIDPTGRGKFVIHKTKMDLSDYRRMVDRGVYEKDSLPLVNAHFARMEDEFKEKSRMGVSDIKPPPWRKEVELLEYWGDVDNKEGDTVHRNVTFTVVNGVALARKPIPNPFRHKKPPFIWGPIFEKEGSEYHEGFGDHVIGIASMINESLNMVLDSNLAASIKAYEVDLNLLHNPGDAKSGVYPGKVFKTNGVPPGSQAVRDFSLGNVNPMSLNILSSLDREFSNATGVNEFVSGTVGVGEQTATEVKQKAGQSLGFMQAISEDIEDNVLTKLVDMTYQNILQYNPEIFGDRVNQMSVDDLRFKYVVKGMSKILKQTEKMGQLFQWIGMVAKTPIGQKINWDSIAEMSARMIDYEPRQLLLNDQQMSPNVGEQPGGPERANMEAQRQALLQQIQGGMK